MSFEKNGQQQSDESRRQNDRRENDESLVDDDVKLTALALGEISDPEEISRLNALLERDEARKKEFESTAQLAGMIRDSVENDLPLAPGSLHDVVLAALSDSTLKNLPGNNALADALQTDHHSTPTGSNAGPIGKEGEKPGDKVSRVSQSWWQTNFRTLTYVSSLSLVAIIVVVVIQIQDWDSHPENMAVARSDSNRQNDEFALEEKNLPSGVDQSLRLESGIAFEEGGKRVNTFSDVPEGNKEAAAGQLAEFNNLGAQLNDNLKVPGSIESKSSQFDASQSSTRGRASPSTRQSSARGTSGVNKADGFIIKGGANSPSGDSRYGVEPQSNDRSEAMPFNAGSKGGSGGGGANTPNLKMGFGGGGFGGGRSGNPGNPKSPAQANSNAPRQRGGQSVKNFGQPGAGGSSSGGLDPKSQPDAMKELKSGTRLYSLQPNTSGAGNSAKGEAAGLGGRSSGKTGPPVTGAKPAAKADWNKNGQADSGLPRFFDNSADKQPIDRSRNSQFYKQPGGIEDSARKQADSSNSSRAKMPSSKSADNKLNLDGAAETQPADPSRLKRMQKSFGRGGDAESSKSRKRAAPAPSNAPASGDAGRSDEARKKAPNAEKKSVLKIDAAASNSKPMAGDDGAAAESATILGELKQQRELEKQGEIETQRKLKKKIKDVTRKESESKDSLRPDSEKPAQPDFASPDFRDSKSTEDDPGQPNEANQGAKPEAEELADAKKMKKEERLLEEAEMDFDIVEIDPAIENPFIEPIGTDAVSTFSIDTDTASYAYVRKMLRSDKLPRPEDVRIEEMVNYFDFKYEPPKAGEKFSVDMELASSPWSPGNKILKIGLQGATINNENRPPSNLVFLVDVSGSMRAKNKLPLLKSGLKKMVEKLREDDYVAIVTYSSKIEVPLSPTDGLQKKKITDVIDSLSAAGGTNGGEGLQTAYRIAEENLLKNGTNRIVLGTDGDFNIGIQDDLQLAEFVKAKAKGGVYLTICGFGSDNFKDAKMQYLSQNGNGKVYYIDSEEESQRVFADRISSSLVTLAKDVKLQMIFNPRTVQKYRLIGYENRMMEAEDFYRKDKDAGEMDAGDSVTALYEIVPGERDFKSPVSNPKPDVLDLKYQIIQKQKIELTKVASSNDIAALKIAFQDPYTKEHLQREFVVKDGDVAFNRASQEFQLATAVAGLGLMLRGSQHRGVLNYESLKEFGQTVLVKRPESQQAKTNPVEEGGEEKQLAQKVVPKEKSLGKKLRRIDPATKKISGEEAAKLQKLDATRRQQREEVLELINRAAELIQRRRNPGGTPASRQ